MKGALCMKYHISDVENKDYAQLIEVWEKSVRATHDFLPDAEIQALKPLILNTYFDAVLLTCCRNIQNEIVGFCGITDKKIEMLFVSPFAQGQGIGSMLCRYAIAHQDAVKVDVNEQNTRAIDFYKKMGFQVMGRSSLDGQGKPYPLLHMALICAETIRF